MSIEHSTPQNYNWKIILPTAIGTLVICALIVLALNPEIIPGLVGFLVLVLIIILGAAFYLAPSIVAIGAKHPSAGGIIVLNLFLGWSLIGWVVAFAWAASSPRTVVQPRYIPVPVKICPKCGMHAQINARFCSNCGYQGG